MFSPSRRHAPDPESLAVRSWEPLRLMDELLAAEPARVRPAVEVRESSNAYFVTADVPGVEEEDLTVSVDQGLLTLTGKRERQEPAEGQRGSTSERWFGSFERAVSLPDADAEGIIARLKNGVLTIVVPKKSAPRLKRSPVQSGT